MVKDGKSTLFGEAWEITGGGMRKVSEENKTYSFMNLVFIMTEPITRAREKGLTGSLSLL